MKTLIMTACPSGMASSYLVARLLRQAAQDLGWQVNVECYSQLEPVTSFTEAQLDEAELVLVAADSSLDLSRFIGKPLYRSDIQSALNDPKAWLQQGRAQAEVQQRETPTGRGKLVAITACPTGVAHTFMAAEALTEAATAMGIQLFLLRRR